MNVLIIGGTRQIGHFLTEALLSAGHRVTVLNRGVTRDDLPETLPRLRVDQLMAFAWKVLVPISLVNLMVTGLLAKLVAGRAPLMVFGAFTVANVAMVALLIWLVAGWRRFNAARQITFERPAVQAVGAALRRGAA